MHAIIPVLSFSLRLFKQVSSTLLSKPTYKALLNLLDNYRRQTGQAEDVPSQEVEEQDTFLQQTMNTDVGMELYNFLHSKGTVYVTAKLFFWILVTSMW